MTQTAVEDGHRIAVLIASRNQAATIGAVVEGFVAALPSATVYVFDNNSTDDTARAATRAGARVYREARQGKGSVVRRMFADIDADIYVLAEGDGGSDPADAPSLVNALITEHVDMVIGTQRRAGGRAATGFPTRAFEWLYRRVFNGGSTDILSGYRALTRRFVRSFPAIRTGFDVEIELSMHASQLMIPVAEIDLSGRPRADAANTSGGALQMLTMTALLMKDTRPFLFYAAFALVFWIAGLALILPLSLSETGSLQPAFADAALGMGLFVGGFFLGTCGLILEALGRSRIEQKRILFLTAPALGGH